MIYLFRKSGSADPEFNLLNVSESKAANVGILEPKQC